MWIDRLKVWQLYEFSMVAKQLFCKAMWNICIWFHLLWLPFKVRLELLQLPFWIGAHQYLSNSKWVKSAKKFADFYPIIIQIIFMLSGMLGRQFILLHVHGQFIVEATQTRP